MDNKPKSFDEFYYSTKDDVLDIDLITRYVDSHNGSIGEYDGKMFCPECRMAELNYVRKTSGRREHLRRCPTAKHIHNCSYNYEYASRKLVKSYITSLSNDKIQDKLNSIINMLCRPVRNIGEENNGEYPNNIINNPMVIKKKEGKEGISKSLRRKQIKVWIDESNCGEYFVFYGKVKLKVVEKESKIHQSRYNLLEICIPNNRVDGELRFRTSLYRGQIKDGIKEDTMYYIAIIGQVGKKSWQIELDNIHAVKYCECD